jgi:hypothetical protein
MSSGVPTRVPGTWREIATPLFKLGATSYGGPAIMGAMQVGHSWFQGGGTAGPMSDRLSQGERS